MLNDFSCLTEYSFRSDDDKRTMAVQAALVLINTSINTGNPFSTLNPVTEDTLISDVADKIQSALNLSK